MVILTMSALVCWNWACSWPALRQKNVFAANVHCALPLESSNQVPPRYFETISQEQLSRHAGTVFAFNAYHIGKERCYFQVASSLGLSIWVSTRRHQTLQRLQLPEEWMSCVTKDKQAADVIVSDTGVGPPQLQELQTELEKPVIGFQCTGTNSPCAQLTSSFWLALHGGH